MAHKTGKGSGSPATLPPGVERRAVKAAVAYRREGDQPVICGYAAVFGRQSDDLGGFREVIQPGAFTASLRRGVVVALLEHDPRWLLGNTAAGTLRLREDGYGLGFEVDPPATTAGRDAVELLKRGDLAAMSFGFRTVQDAWREETAGRIRTLHEVALYDVSLVAFPAYPDTSVALRSLETAGRPMASAGVLARMKRQLTALEYRLEIEEEDEPLPRRVNPRGGRRPAQGRAELPLAEARKALARMERGLPAELPATSRQFYYAAAKEVPGEKRDAVRAALRFAAADLDIVEPEVLFVTETNADAAGVVLRWAAPVHGVAVKSNRPHGGRHSIMVNVDGTPDELFHSALHEARHCRQFVFTPGWTVDESVAQTYEREACRLLRRRCTVCAAVKLT